MMTAKQIMNGTIVTFKKALENPELLDSGKSWWYPCNAAGFENLAGQPFRKVQYDFEKNEWIISDIDLGDGFEEAYCKHFTKYEMNSLEQFKWMLEMEGYVI